MAAVRPKAGVLAEPDALQRVEGAEQRCPGGCSHPPGLALKGGEQAPTLLQRGLMQILSHLAHLGDGTLCHLRCGMLPSFCHSALCFSVLLSLRGITAWGGDTIYSFCPSWGFGEAKQSLHTTWLCGCELVNQAETCHPGLGCAAVPGSPDSAQWLWGRGAVLAVKPGCKTCLEAAVGDSVLPLSPPSPSHFLGIKLL